MRKYHDKFEKNVDTFFGKICSDFAKFYNKSRVKLGENRTIFE